MREDIIQGMAEAIARHGVGRPWDDFHECYAHDLDQNDLIAYATAAFDYMLSRLMEPSREMIIAARPYAGVSGSSAKMTIQHALKTLESDNE